MTPALTLHNSPLSHPRPHLLVLLVAAARCLRDNYGIFKKDAFMDGRSWVAKTMRTKRPKILFEAATECAAYALGGFGKRKEVSLAVSALITRTHVESMANAQQLITLLFPSQAAKHLSLPLVSPKIPDVQRGGKRWRATDPNTSSSTDPHQPVRLT